MMGTQCGDLDPGTFCPEDLWCSKAPVGEEYTGSCVLLTHMARWGPLEFVIERQQKAWLGVSPRAVFTELSEASLFGLEIWMTREHCHCYSSFVRSEVWGHTFSSLAGSHHHLSLQFIKHFHRHKISGSSSQLWGHTIILLILLSDELKLPEE